MSLVPTTQNNVWDTWWVFKPGLDSRDRLFGVWGLTMSSRHQLCHSSTAFAPPDTPSAASSLTRSCLCRWSLVFPLFSSSRISYFRHRYMVQNEG